MKPLLVAIIGVVGVLAGTAVWAPYRTIRCATALMLIAAFFFRSSRSVPSIGDVPRLVDGAKYDADDQPDDAEISRSNDARFHDQSNTPIHKS
jgi:hypothetical protein